MLKIGQERISLQQVAAAAQGEVKVALSDDPGFVERMERSQALLLQTLQDGLPIYGVSTGYGACCGNRLENGNLARLELLGSNLLRYHGCGVGEPLGVAETRAAMLCRMICLAQGYSGVSRGLLEQIAALLNLGITPLVPSLGSVGASGDLTPMSYIAAALAGEREVLFQERRMPAALALEQAGLQPYRFKLKEPLALINGTSIMTGIAVINLVQSRRILQGALAGTALALHALAGHAEQFHEVVSAAKPHPGQIEAGRALYGLLESSGPVLESDNPTDLQDPYSIRCAPQILGVAGDALRWIEEWIEIEINSANDNPLLDPHSGRALMGGNFYGGHVAFAMDALKSALAGLADMADRQIALLVDPRFSRGLPGNLVKVDNGDQDAHHGFKGMQITASALAAEAQKNTMPAAVFSRSTESHNQDKVSMGTIAARDAQRQCFLVGRVAAVQLLVAAQGAELRGGLDSRPRIARLVQRVRAVARDTLDDRPMDADIERLIRAVLEADWSA